MGYETVQQSYGPTSVYSYQSVNESKFPDVGSFPMPTYPPTYGPHHSYGLPSANNHYGGGANNYPGSKVHASVKPNIDGYGSSRYENTYTYENSQQHGRVSPHNPGHGSPHYASSYAHENSYEHENPHHYGHGSPYGYKHTHGSPTGFGGVATNLLSKLRPGHNNHEYSYTHENSHQYHGNGSQFDGHGIGHNQGMTPTKYQFHTSHNKYGSSSPNYGTYPGGYQHNYWEKKAIDDEDLTSENK